MLEGVLRCALIYTVSQKTTHFAIVHNFAKYIFTDFLKFFTGTLCKQLAIMWLLNIPLTSLTAHKTIV